MKKIRFNKPTNKTAQNDRALKLFGNGADGTVVISTNHSISRDMYYNNLTVNSGITLFTNGFKIFVKGTLANSGTVGMPSGTSQTTSVLAGSVMTRDDGSAGYSSADAIDGTIASIASIDDYDSLIYGVRQTGLQIKRWYPGAKGAAGSDGVDGTDGNANPGGAAPSPAGGATAGNAGPAGTKGFKGTGGSFGHAGGSVVIVANSITGSGTFVSEGTSGGSGTSGSSGNLGVSGNAGTTVAGNANLNPATANHTDAGTGATANHTDAGSGATANHHDSGSGHTANHGNGGGIAWHNPATNNPTSNPNHQHPHNVAGNSFHNPGAHYGAAHNPSTVIRATPPKTHNAAHHRPASHVAGNVGHNPSHHTHKGHSHTIHTAAAHGHNPNHPFVNGYNPNHHAVGNHNANGHSVSGHNANTHNVTGHNANTHNVTGHSPGTVAGHNPSFPGGIAGTANSGNSGTSGTSGTAGAPGTLVIFTRDITTNIANSNVTIIKDIDS